MRRAVLAVAAAAVVAACTSGGEVRDPAALLHGAAGAARSAPGATFSFTFESVSPAGPTKLYGDGRVDFRADTAALRVSFGEYGTKYGLPGTLDAFTHGTRYWLALPPARRTDGKEWVATTITEASIAMSTFVHPPYALDLLRATRDVEETEAGAGTRRLRARLVVKDLHTVVPDVMREPTRALYANDSNVADLDVVLDGEGRPTSVTARYLGRAATFTLTYGPVEPVVLPSDTTTRPVDKVGDLTVAAFPPDDKP